MRKWEDERVECQECEVGSIVDGRCNFCESLVDNDDEG